MQRLSRTTKSDSTLRRLDAINNWLDDVYGGEMRLSVILREAGLSETQIELLKQNHLTHFLQAVVNLIVDNIEMHDGERRNSVMVRHYGLADGEPETLQSIGDGMGLTRERIRQLVKKRLQLYRREKHKTQFRMDIAGIALELLSD